jgi:intraflagellar transport protein 74
MDSMQSEISTLEGRINKMREQMSGAVIKQEALTLVEQIYELELKREQLSNESKSILTPDQERQKLTQQVKEDNQEVAAMDKQINELRERNENLKQSYENDDIQSSILVQQQNKSSDAVDEDTKQKYIELKKREQHIDEFSSTYEQTREQSWTDIKNVQKTNLTLLALISRTLVKGDQVLTRDDYTQLKTNIDQHEVEKKKSSDTLAILAEQHRKVKQDYSKVETLDQKLTDELQELRKQYAKMQEDLEKFADLEGLKRKAEKRKIQLAADKSNMGKQRQVTKMEIQTLQSQFEAAQTQLRDNETHQQVIQKIFARNHLIIFFLAYWS